MRATDAAKEAEAQETGDRQAAVNQAVVDHRVGDAEERHSGADPREHCAGGVSTTGAGGEQRHRDRDVEQREEVVLLERALPRLVVGPME